MRFKPLDRILIWLKRINASFLPIEVSESDFRQWRENSPRIKPTDEPARELWWDGEQWH